MPRHTSDRQQLKANLWRKFDTMARDQALGEQQPPLQQPIPADAPLIDLAPAQDLTIGAMPLIQAIAQRKSRRRYVMDPLTMEELSFLLWATQGVRQLLGKRLLRTAPSAGARQPFETYLVIENVTGLEPGLYRYLSLSHQLAFLQPRAALEGREAMGWWVKEAAITFIWTAIPYRSEWRYAELAPKLIAMDAGHVCQNLYLACEAIGCGTCAIGAYDQEIMDTLIGVDGHDEFTVYVAPVGRVAPEKES